METFTIVIAGSRTITDYQFIAQHMDSLLAQKRQTHEIAIVCGGAPGADAIGRKYAEMNHFKVITVPAQWEKITSRQAVIREHANGTKYNAAAGMLRNVAMAKLTDAVVVFIEHNSPGSSHMIATARKYYKPVRVINYQRKDVGQ